MATWLPARQRSSTSLDVGSRCITDGNSRFRASTHNGGNQCAIFTAVTDGIMADVGLGEPPPPPARAPFRVVFLGVITDTRRACEQFRVPCDNQSSLRPDQISHAYLTGWTLTEFDGRVHCESRCCSSRPRLSTFRTCHLELNNFGNRSFSAAAIPPVKWSWFCKVK